MPAKLTQKYIENWFLERDSKLIGEFRGVDYPINFNCAQCGDVVKYSKYTKVKRVYRCLCKECRKRLIGVNKVESKADEVKMWLKEHNSELISKYQGANKRIFFKCTKCGGIGDYFNFRGLKRSNKLCLCRKCTYINNLGENSSSWNFNLTEEDRKHYKYGRGEDFKRWVRLIFKRDNYTCCITGQIGGKLSAHHLNNWADYSNERYILGNGVTLSRKIHRLFHRRYGNKHNTKEQFIEFMKDLK